MNLPKSMLPGACKNESNKKIYIWTRDNIKNASKYKKSYFDIKPLYSNHSESQGGTLARKQNINFRP